MIKNIKHKGLKTFFETRNTKGIRPDHATRLRLRLAVLDNAITLDDIAAHNWGLHTLSGDKAGQYAIKISGNWRLFFKFENSNVFYWTMMTTTKARNNDHVQPTPPR